MNNPHRRGESAACGGCILLQRGDGLVMAPARAARRSPLRAPPWPVEGRAD